jgi:hypothetical protein
MNTEKNEEGKKSQKEENQVKKNERNGRCICTMRIVHQREEATSKIRKEIRT